MGTIISSGVGSGLDITGLVSQLVQAEGQQKQIRLNVEEATAQARLSALATLRSALAELQSAADELGELDQFRGRRVVLSGEEFVSATAATTAVPASYTIEVERLASSHRLASGAFADQDTAVGTGTLTLGIGGAAFTVEIDAQNNTVAGIAAAVNAAPGNTGIRASVINGVDGARLILGAEDTGAANTITVTESDGDGGLAALVYDPGNLENLTEIQAAQDARALINSFAVESATNSLSGAVAGVEISLLAVNAVGETTQLTIDFDRAAARANIERLVDSYNNLLDTVASVASYDPETQESGPLFGDAGLRNVVFQLRRVLNGAVAGLAGPFELIQQVGVETELDGKLSIDPTRLDAAFDADFDAIGELFSTAESGIAVGLDALLEGYLGSGGILDVRDAAVKTQIDGIADRREVLTERLSALEDRLFSQFTALDGLLAELQATSNFLAQQLASLPGSDFFARAKEG